MGQASGQPALSADTVDELGASLLGGACSAGGFYDSVQRASWGAGARRRDFVAVVSGGEKQ